MLAYSGHLKNGVLTMCCFSQPIEHVSSTNIFARMSASGKQYLVYSMELAAQDDLAMILPIPAPEASPDDAVRFISLEEYPRFFDDMDSGFAPLELSMKAGPVGAAPVSAPPLVVHDVGAFEASFVPTVADFNRLDARFRLPKETWSSLPGYRDFGFAVFKLRRSAGPRTIHPMAFEFPLRDQSALHER
ncbi:MAG: hypothetical protein JJE39_12580 [Vicinamibacteria bacterium]|nr:hypothetical protein [Vicinamibacteria bacterium]